VFRCLGLPRTCPDAYREALRRKGFFEFLVARHQLPVGRGTISDLGSKDHRKDAKAQRFFLVSDGQFPVTCYQC
jgi:hypothetical protein